VTVTGAPSALILGREGIRLFAAETGILLTSGVLCQKTKTGKVEHPLGILGQSGGIVVRKLAAQRLQTVSFPRSVDRCGRGS
jgi:hypothetical protein